MRYRWTGQARVGIAMLMIALGVVACDRESAPATVEVQPMTLRHEVSAEGVLAAARVTPVTVPRGARGSLRLAWLVPEGTVVQAGEVVARFDDSDFLSELDAGHADLRSTAFEFEKTHAEQAKTSTEIEADREVASLELEVAERFQLTDNVAFSRREILESSIDGELAAARMDHAAFAAETALSGGQAALDILEIQRRQNRARVDRAEEGLGSLVIEAPHEGLFLRARDWNQQPIDVGAELWAGNQVGEIPDTESLQVEAFVLEADAGGLEVGKAASVIVEAHPDTVYEATIHRVDSLAKPRSRGSPVQYFGVTLILDSEAFAASDAARLKPGQRVKARLHLDTWTDVIAVPRQAVVTAGDGYRVYRWSAGGLEPIAVELGPSATGMVTIASGLTAGDRIALDPPSAEMGTTAPPATATADTAVEGGP